MFLHYRCTHDPYYKHEKDFGDDDSDKYDSALHHCDDQIARLLEAAEARQDAQRTAIIVFSDHGELFGEHGGHYHGETLFEPDARIVLLAKVPGSDTRTVETPVSLADLAPTVMSLGGAKVPDRIDGWSLLPLLFDAAVDPAWAKRPLFVTTDLNRAGIHYTAAATIDFPFKYIWDMRTGMKELYDVMKDPLERSPLADPQRTSQMTELLERWLASHAPKRVKSAMTEPPKKAGKKKRKKIKNED
jgi:arylsulfatase A-like enzyme